MIHKLFFKSGKLHIILEVLLFISRNIWKYGIKTKINKLCSKGFLIWFNFSKKILNSSSSWYLLSIGNYLLLHISTGISLIFHKSNFGNNFTHNKVWISKNDFCVNHISFLYRTKYSIAFLWFKIICVSSIVFHSAISL